MLSTLIESRARRKTNTTGTVAAIAAHALLIGGAAYATAAADPGPDSTPTVLVRVIAPVATPKKTPQTPPSSSRPATARNSGAVIPKLSIDVSPDLPAIDIPLADPSSASGADFPSIASGTASAATSTVEPAAYDESEVESPVAVYSGLKPEYPASLRAAGIEGRVVAQFTVRADGKPDPESVRILSSTNDMFAESVRKAVLKSYFKPARIGSKNVPQLVQQLFVFKLDR